MAKKQEPIIKKTFNLDAYKESNQLNEGIIDKPLEYIQLSPAFQRVAGLSVVKGTVNIFRGFSNTGKSTALIEAAIGAQRAGIIPVIIDLENAWKWGHAEEMGFEFDYVYKSVTDEETGEITKKAVTGKGEFIYINNDYLIEHFGKKRDKDRDEAVIEDLAQFIDKCLNDQKKGLLDGELLFIIDSIGTLDCEQCITSNNRNNQWNAGAYEAAFKSILNYKIPASAKENKKYTNTILVVNKIWLDNMGMGVMMLKGGNAFLYSSRLMITFGGVLSAGVKKMIAKADGKDYVYGTQTKLTVDKNHITGTSNTGAIIATAHGFIMPDEIDQYKKENKAFILAKLGVSLDTEVTYTEEFVLSSSDMEQ